jgi:ABC-type uncharacterized transport system auxiliary subunit
MKPQRLLAAVVAASLLLGCGAFARKPPAKQRYLLAVGTPAATATARDPGVVLRVDVVRAAPLLVNRGFLYRVADDRVESDFYNELAVPPGPLVRDALIDWLRASGRFGSVVRGSKAEPHWIVESDLERFEADVRDPAALAAAIVLEVRLLDARGAPTRVVFERSYAATEPVPSRAPQALVDAWGRGLARSLAEIERDLEAAMRAAAAPRR